MNRLLAVLAVALAAVISVGAGANARPAVALPPPLPDPYYCVIIAAVPPATTELKACTPFLI